MDRFLSSIRDKMAHVTEEARKGDDPDQVIITETENLVRIAEQENEERRQKEELMARTLTKLNQDEILSEDDIAHVSASGIESQPATALPSTMTDAVKDVIQEQTTKLIDIAGVSVLKKPSSPEMPQLQQKPENEKDDEDLATRFAPAFWD